MVVLSELVLSSVSWCNAVINLALCTAMLKKHVGEMKKYHINYVFLRTNFIGACYGISLFRFINALTELLDWAFANAPLSAAAIKWINIFEMCSSHLLRTTFIGIAIERLVATAYSSRYEQDAHFRYLCIVLMPFVYVVAWLLTLTFYHGILTFPAMFSVAASLDLMCCTGLLVLRYCNKRLRLIKSTTRIELSQRYQITENLKVLNNVQLLIFLGTLFLLIASFAVLTLQNMLMVWGISTSSFFYPIMNVYVTIACLIVLFHNFDGRNFRSRVSDLHNAMSDGSGRVATNGSQSNVAPQLMNILGQRIDRRPSIEGHFEMLKRSWQ